MMTTGAMKRPDVDVEGLKYSDAEFVSEGRRNAVGCRRSSKSGNQENN